MPANKIGPNRAITERARRRGYSQAVADVVSALTDRAPKRVLGRLIDWRAKVYKWRGRLHAGSDPAAECEPAPPLAFTHPTKLWPQNTFKQGEL